MAGRNFARPNNVKELSAAEAKAKVLGLLANGAKVAAAMAAVGRKPATYTDWYKHDPEFKQMVQELRAVRQEMVGDGPAPIPDFPTFCRDFLRQPLYIHQLRMWDAIEGRVPRDIDDYPVFRYDRGTEWESRNPNLPAGRVIVNLPPGFAKTTTFSINYVTWLIHKDPNAKIIILCKDLGLATQILGAIKFRLTSPIFREMHLRFAPEGGWKDPDGSWTQTEIYVAGKGDGEKDPSIQAKGLGGRIYGARTDVVIGDDMVTLANVNEYDGQHKKLDQEIESRLDGAGLLALLGTRVAPMDLYKKMRDVTDFDDKQVYTYFSMPAVLDEGDGKPENWVSLWPERFSGQRLRKIRRDEMTWALVYQQQDVSDDQTFNAKAVQASINSQRFPGPMTVGGMGHREGGMAGLYVVLGVDPATVGNTAMVVMGVDKATGKRYVLDGYNQKGATPRQIRDTIKRFVETYRVNEAVIERNAFQRFLTQDEELMQWMRARGCKLTEHYTTSDKYAADFGVAAMAQLFMTCGTPPSNGGGGDWKKTPDTALIELPSPKQNAWVGELVNQLVIWQPSGMKQSARTDLVMALWFAEIGCKKIVERKATVPSHLNNPWLSRQRRDQRQVIPIQDYLEQQRAAREGAA